MPAPRLLAPLLRWLDARIDARIAEADAARKAEYRALAGAIAEARPVAGVDAVDGSSDSDEALRDAQKLWAATARRDHQRIVDTALADARATDGAHSAAARGGAQ